MLCMMKMEFTVFARYLKQMVFTLTFTMACVAAGMGTISVLPSIAFIMMMFSMSMSGAVHDEQNDWGAYRLVLPLSRRDVVLGRYAFNLLVSLCAAAGASVLVAALVLLGRALPVTGFAASLLAWNDEAMMAAVAGTVVCVFLGLVSSSVTLPAFFKLGQTKATQWLPFIMMLLSVAPFMVIAVVGGEVLATVEQMIQRLIETGGMGVLGVVAVVAALGVYAASACISIRLYEARDL